MLITRKTEALEHYAPLLSPDVQLHTAVTLELGAPYFFLSYTTDKETTEEMPDIKATLMWQFHDVMELLTYIKGTGGRVLCFNLIECPSAETSYKLTSREVSELWVGSTLDRTHFLCHLSLRNGDSHVYHGATPTTQSFARMEQLY